MPFEQLVAGQGFWLHKKSLFLIKVPGVAQKTGNKAKCPAIHII
jgi:hypothetical protein